jgi:type II secretory pathway component PulF
LPGALAAEGDRLPELYRAVVEVGLRSGRLSAALEGLARFARGYAEMRREIGLALVYPLIVLTFAYTLFVAFVLEVAPRFLAAFESLRVPLQRVLLGLNALGRTVWFWGPIVPVLLLVAAAWWIVSGRAASLRAEGASSPLYWLPWMGPMLTSARAACFADVLALLIEHRAPLPEAIALAARAVGDRPLQREGMRVAESLNQGQSLRDALRDATAIPPLLRWLLATGQSQGNLLAALQHAAESYRRRTLDQAEIARVFLPKLLMFAIGATATALFALTLFVPLSALLKGLALE